MNLDQEMSDSLPTIPGSIVSLVMTFALMFFAFYRIYFGVIKNTGWQMVSTIKDHKYAADEIFGHEQGFDIALTLWDDVPPSIGKVVVEILSWNETDVESFPIKTHTCTPEELGLTENREGARFMQINQNYANDLKEYNGKLICFDIEQMYINGYFNSDVARKLVVQLERCQGEDKNCSDAETINDFYKNNMIGFLSNRIRFDPTLFGEEAVIQESEFFWEPISTQVQQEMVFEVQRTELQLQDLPINLDDLTELTDSSVFKVK